MNYLAKALGELRPKEGMIYNSELPPIANKIIYDSESTIKITQEELDNKIAELEAAEPMRLLRIERDRLIQQTDWRATVDYPNPDKQAWLDYRQALRDLPETADPQLDENGQLTNVIWPLSPEEQ
jgi:hypothetical protein